MRLVGRAKSRAVSARLWAILVVIALLTSGCVGAAGSGSDPAPSRGDGDLGAAEVYRNQVYAQRDSGALTLDVFLPARSRKPSPLVVYVHGGGWEAGNRRLDGGVATSGAAEALAAEQFLKRGYAVATVDYRLSTVARAPAQVLDVADAVRWLQQQGQRWNLDPDRVVLWGASAGGQIVAQLAAVAGDPGKPGSGLGGIRAVVDWFGPTDMTAETQTRTPELKEYSRRVMEKFLGCAPVDCPAAAEQSSPIKNLSGDEPPFLIQHGTADSIVPIDQSLDFAAELRRHNVPVALHPYEGVDHGFPHGQSATQVVDPMMAFADTNLR
jgi:acetyl esterase/lipase